MTGRTLPQLLEHIDETLQHARDLIVLVGSASCSHEAGTHRSIDNARMDTAIRAAELLDTVEADLQTVWTLTVEKGGDQ